MGDTQSKLKQILIVEDNFEMQSLYRRMFKDRTDRFEIDIVNEARLAFKKLSERDFDLIILDLIMEPLGGETFYACIRDDLKKRNIQVLVVSVINPDNLEHMKELSHVNFLQKPIQEEELVNTIEGIIG